MHEIVLVNETHLGVPPHEAFGMFGRTGGPGWLFSARFEHAEPGAAAGIDIPLPFAAPGGETTVRGTARIVEMRPYRRIVLRHETPWTGRLTMTFAREPGGTRVRTVTELGQEALGWMTGGPGCAAPGRESRAGDTCVALLTSMSGSAGLFGRAAANCAALAAEEINAEGGIGGRPVRVEVIDDHTHGATGLARLRELDQRRGLAVGGNRRPAAAEHVPGRSHGHRVRDPRTDAVRYRVTMRTAWRDTGRQVCRPSRPTARPPSAKYMS